MSTDLVESQKASGSMVEVQTGRVIQEVQAAMTIAKRFPRDETTAIERIRQACKRVGLAETAVYQYPRGGIKVEGASIRLAEALAQNWGNLDFGIIELDQRDGESHVMSYCWDLETNTRQTKVFTVPHERHTKQAISKLSSPRDIYEVVANQGARRLRACILGIIPGDVQDRAVQWCRETLTGDPTKPLADKIRDMVIAFADFGVSKEMLERRVGHNLGACDEHALVGLRTIYTSMRDNMSKREDWFQVEAAEAVASHKEQARQQRMVGAADAVVAGEASQVDPKVDAADGIDDPAEIVEEKWCLILAEIQACKTIMAVNAIEGNLNLDSDAAPRLKKACADQRFSIRSARGGKSG